MSGPVFIISGRYHSSRMERLSLGRESYNFMLSYRISL